MVLLLASPTFAQSRDSRRGNDGGFDRRGAETNQDRNDRGQQNHGDGRGNNDRSASRSYRDNERVDLQGRVRSFNRDRDGYRVELDNGRNSFWVPQSYVRNRRLNVGLSISLGGIFRNGLIYVDAVGWPGDRGGSGRYDRNDNGYVSGSVERVDGRNEILWLRDRSSGRVIEADLGSVRRSSRLDAGDLRRGDYVELSGVWSRNNVFEADRIDRVDSRR